MYEFFKLLLPWQKAPNDQISDLFVYGILLSFLICLGIFLVKTIRRCSFINGLVAAVRRSTEGVSKNSKSVKPEILYQLEEAFSGISEVF